MADIKGFEQLTRQLSEMGKSVGGKVLRAAAMQAMLPALRAAQAAAPVGNPPFPSGKDPYPVKTYKGSYRTPGYASRHVARKSILSRNGRFVKVMLGVTPEAFYAINFIEFGTSKIPKRPWLEPSFKNSVPQVSDRLRERLKAQIDRAARKK